MLDKKRFSGSLFITSFATLALIGFAYLGNYTRFMADDYCSAYYAQRLGLFRSIWYWYLAWSGRYTAFAFDWLIMVRTFGPYGMHFVPPLAIAIWTVSTIVAIYLSLKLIAPHSATLSLAAVIGTCFTLVVIVLSPDIAQSFFWLNGMRSYSLPLMIASVYVVLFQWIVPHLRSNSSVLWTCIVAIVLTFINGGLSETYALLQFALLAFLTGLYWISHAKKPDATFKVLAAATLGALVSVIVVALAPGNVVRKASFPPSPSFITLMNISLGAYFSFFKDVLLSLQKISMLIGALLISAWAGVSYKNQINFPGWMIPAQIIGGLALLFICIPPAVSAYIEPPPPRTLSIAVFALMIFWLNASFLAGRWFASRMSSTVQLEIGLFIPAGFMIALACVLTFSYVNTQKDAYVSFAQKWDATDAKILQAHAQHLQSVDIPKMDSWAKLDYPTSNPRFWATACYSKYYDIQVYGP